MKVGRKEISGYETGYVYIFVIPNLSPLQSKALFTFEFIGLNEYFQILRFLFKHCQENKQKVEIILATSVDLFTTCLFIWVSTAAKYKNV